jgi:hypothetical protein
VVISVGIELAIVISVTPAANSACNCYIVVTDGEGDQGATTVLIIKVTAVCANSRPLIDA